MQMGIEWGGASAWRGLCWRLGASILGRGGYPAGDENHIKSFIGNGLGFGGGGDGHRGV